MNFFQDAYLEGGALWETGRPQPEVIALCRAGEIAGEVLDAGCGTGENAIHLSGLGLPVTAVDLAPRAVEIARSKAAERGAGIRFAVCDVRSLPFPAGSFDTALDSGVFHVFDDNGKAAYERGLRRVVRPGGRVHVIVWSEHQSGDEGPARMTRAELRRYFAAGWDRGRIRAGLYETAIHERGAAAWVASFVRSSGADARAP